MTNSSYGAQNTEQNKTNLEIKTLVHNVRTQTKIYITNIFKERIIGQLLPVTSETDVDVLTYRRNRKSSIVSVITHVVMHEVSDRNVRQMMTFL